MPGNIDARLTNLKIELPISAAPAANYVPYVIEFGTLYIAGQIPFWNGKILHVGKVGDDISLEEAVTAARVCGLNIIAQAKAALQGDLDRVKQITKVGGFVNAAPNFAQHPEVLNGASDLFVQIFGNAGKHARFAVGVSSLPRGVSVEVDAILTVHSE